MARRPQTSTDAETTEATPKRRFRPMNKFIAAERISRILDEIPFAERALVLDFVRHPRQPELPIVGSA